MARRFYVSPVTGTGTRADPQRAQAADLVRNHAAEIFTLPTGKTGKSFALVAIDDAADDPAILDTAPGHMAFPVDLDMAVGTLPPADLTKARNYLTTIGIYADDLVPGSPTTVGEVVDRVGKSLNPTYDIAHHFVVGV